MVLNMIEISDVTKKFGPITALDSVTLSIQSREFFGLLGPNGAGKTTLMNILIGYVVVDQGELSLFNKKFHPDDLEIRKDIGLVPQYLAIYEDISAIENLEIFGGLYHINKSLLKERINEQLNAVGLYERRKDKVKTYSGGMKRRLNLIASLLHDPSILLCDEPTVGIDPQSRNAIFEYLTSLNEEGKTIVYTTHYMDEADYLCDRIGIIDKGKILVIDTTINLKNSIGNDVITLSCNEIDKLLIGLQKEPWIKNTKIHDSFLTIGVENGEEKIPTIVEIARNIGLKIISINLRKPTLDDVFLSYTGKNIRSEEPEQAFKKIVRNRFKGG